MRGTIRNNTSQFQRFTPGILQDHCDALGSVRRVTNENGTSRWNTRYYPFGEMFTQAGTGNTHTFTGKEWDAEMNLNYFCQRYYDPEIGRFMPLDPQGSAASSPYAYCANNPLIFTDPTGAVTQMAMPAAFFDAAGRSDYSGMGWWDYDIRTARSSQLDPDFWSPGWDWDCPNNDLIRQAMFLLSSGIFEWDILTDNGWVHINIGEWIKANDIQINNFPVGRGQTDFFRVTNKMIIDVGIANNVWDLMSLIAHEATHLLANRGGWLGYERAEIKAAEADMITGTRQQQELWATGTMLDLFGDRLSPDFRQGAQNYLQAFRNAPVWPGW
jgi:RHS repeat-associated protein